MEEGELFKYLVEFHKGIGIELRTGLDSSSWKKVSMVTFKGSKLNSLKYGSQTVVLNFFFGSQLRMKKKMKGEKQFQVSQDESVP
jgi:hypothetical protein